MFKAPFSFNGRIKRGEYILSFVIYVVSAITFSALSEAIPLIGLVLFPVLWFLWAQGAKRCHDIGRNGWYQIIPFYFVVLMSTPSDMGLNKYDGAYKESIPDVLDTHE
ncbi:MAG: hypothetical protein K0R51_27 [Cytophagaceae bacterium]|jgi:uncharacterized membrane protein YhaH (DUF805 family)|nr:hypothetical protein [Cytophagaceae bacterium]